jgi:shikimate kinase
MGAGKTTIGTRVAKRLGLPFIDSDRELERRTGHTARQILAEQGEDALHAQEADVVMQALDAPDRSVVAAPASIVDTPALRDRIRREDAVWLKADPQVLAERTAKSHNAARPFVDRDPSVLVRQYEERKDLYRVVASLVVDTTTQDKDEAADEIVDWLT